jgi:glycosyltransferase involved in cell wall biosynthesis
MNRPIRILHVLGRLNRGGTEIRTLDLLRYLEPGEFHTDFCALSGQPGVLDEEARSRGAQIHYCAITRPDFPVQFIRLLRHHTYDIVHSHIHMTSGIILSLARMAGVRGRITHFRSSQSGGQANARRRTQEWILRQLIQMNATQILSVCESTFDLAWRPHWREDPRCAVVYNGIERELFLGVSDRRGVRQEFDIPDDAQLIIHVGRLRQPKNHTRLLSIVAHLEPKVPNMYLLLVGEGPLRPVIEEESQRLNLTDRIILAGDREDVPRLLRGADLMIFPSLWEGLPGAVLEGLAAEIPVLASNLPVMAEIQRFHTGLYTLGLEEEDVVWAQFAESLLLHAERADEAQWQRSPFTIENASRAMTDIWRKAAHVT